MFRFTECLPVLVLFALLLPAVVLGQQSTGNLVGTVSDPAGGLVPGLETVDFVATKVFQIKESLRLDFRAESFNSFNHVNLGSADNALTSPAFGTIGSAQTPRVIQFAMKIAF